MHQKWTVMIIDDEPAARGHMMHLINGFQNYLQVVGEAGRGEAAIISINELKPDLIFLDIGLPDMTGFDVLEKISYKPKIIFTTAYEQYAIKAFDELAVDYLLKPIKEERFVQSMEKLKHFSKLNSDYLLPDLKGFIDSLKSKKPPTAFTVKSGSRFILLNFSEISHFEADDKYVHVHTADGNKYLSDIPLNKLSDRLTDDFFRIQKSYIINKRRIKEMHKHFNGRFLFIMDNKQQTRLTSGLTYFDAIKHEFGL